MPDPRRVMEALADALESSFGPAPRAQPLRELAGGGAQLLGSSILDVQLRGAGEGPPEVHERSEMMQELGEYGPLERVGVSADGLRADLWRWSSRSGDEQLIELIATFTRGGQGYRLTLSSNSIDFAKGLGHELPAGLSWDALLERVADFIGAPPPKSWAC